MEMVKLRAVDETGTLFINFFNRAYVRSQLHRGQSLVFFGRVSVQNLSLIHISSRTPTPTEGGKRAACRRIYCDIIPRLGRGWRNVVTPAKTVTAGRCV